MAVRTPAFRPQCLPWAQARPWQPCSQHAHSSSVRCAGIMRRPRRRHARSHLLTRSSHSDCQPFSPLDNAPSTGGERETTYKALLAILARFSRDASPVQAEAEHAPPSASSSSSTSNAGSPPPPPGWRPPPHRLEAFARACPESVGVPFICWLADLEARAPRGPQREQMGQLCAWLVALRDLFDREGQEELYADSLEMLAGGEPGEATLLAARPEAYALRLAEAVTGHAPALAGYSPAYDALLRVASPAALTPEGVANGVALAHELAEDMRQRRRRSYAAVVGRTRLSAEQEAALLAGSPAARILDMLLGLPSHEARAELLPDCFTPPPEGERHAASAAAAAGEPPACGNATDGSSADEMEGSDMLWCSPVQLLNEVEARLKQCQTSPPAEQGVNAEGGGSAGRTPLLRAAHGLVGAAYEDALQALSQVIRAHWLASL